ncbi:hypothetical protein A2Z67_05135 [Candidatus Woesebacteria bacterium RBG_13_36_22]|uniref:Uncharacterized protein n=1 Tax=Candidatus Woesebacteria bacterium RBG_13_36_22 TaxID=1802478 RepID=A0A1F7X2J3_9BACT|nr:MAG: hypothetical protein A2Z67_05135 [Candidatus Woesebacteria bacterium RBG_13_36_22]
MGYIEEDIIEFFRCSECNKLNRMSEVKEIRVRNVIFPTLLCKECFKKIGGDSDDSKSVIGDDEGSSGEDRKV